MNRRSFLTTALATAAVLRSHTIFAQPTPNTHGAVVIGVDKAGDLPKLSAASSGATKVASWLSSEGYRVKLLVDENGPVRASDVFDEVAKFVSAATFEQLVVYFAGHGFVSGSLSEFWMLSGAPQNPNEAISLTESSALARESGIPNVVLISDACRSQPNNLETMRLHGQVIFSPPPNPPSLISAVDEFLAARIGTSAFETTLERGMATEGVYTSCFLEAFKRPYPTIVETVSGISVVTNRKLKDYLKAEVPRKIQAISIDYNQQPDSRVMSEDAVYIARVTSDERSAGTTPPVTLSDVARAEISASRGVDPGVAPMQVPVLNALRKSSGFGDAKDAIVKARGLSAALSSRCGFVVSGQHVKAISARPGITTKITRSAVGDAPSSLIEVDLGDARAASVALRFEDDTGTVLAGLRDYVGNVVADRSGVKNVSYVPSKTSPLRGAYEHEAGRLEELRDSVATAAQFGVFRFDGPKATRQQAASEMANRIRVLKGIDPTLGIYAAYAYDDAGLKEQARSVGHYLRMTLSVDLFDISSLTGNPDLFAGRFPCCPMLSQGWALLRVKKTPLADYIAAARDHLRISLWLSLDSTGMSIVEDALKSGRVA